jgi:hypothetical protein
MIRYVNVDPRIKGKREDLIDPPVIIRLAKFNEETGIVIIVSTAGDEIAPGKGPVAEVIGEKIPGEEPSLSQVMLADTNRQLL